MTRKKITSVTQERWPLRESSLTGRYVHVISETPTIDEKRVTVTKGREGSIIVSERSSATEAPFLTISSVVPREWMKGSYLDLVAAVIRSGLRTEGPDYLRTYGGRYWCSVGNLDPDAVMRVAVKQDIASYQKYHKGQALSFDNYHSAATVVTELC